jgi:MscS family membrane protein
MKNALVDQLRFVFLAVLVISSYWNMGAQSTDSLDISIDSVYTAQDSAKIVSFNNPLETTNRSSPRAVLMNFMENMNSSYTFLMDANERNLEIPGYFIADEVKEDVKKAEFFFERATYCMDLRKFPPSLQKDLGYGRAIMLKEVLDKINLPDFEEVPDYQDVEIDLETKKNPKLNSWKIPNTEIILVKVEEGILQGEYMFSAETVEKLPKFYDQVKNLPYKTDREVTEGFYDFYISTPGLLMPPRWSEYLPEWSTKMYYYQTIWQWLAMLISVLVAFVVIRILNRILILESEKVSLLIRKWSKAIFYACLIVITGYDLGCNKVVSGINILVLCILTYL